jgi:hypothetical protein
MTKIICIGDPHFKTDNVKNVHHFTSRLYDFLSDIDNIDMIVVLGDLLHTHERLHTIPLNLAYDFIRKLSMFAPTYVLVGNHDMINNQQFLSTNHWMNSMKYWDNVIIVDTVINVGNYIFCPYVPNGRFKEALNTCDIDITTTSIIFAHQEFKGCKMGAIESNSEDVWTTNDGPYIVSGHIHARQFITDTQEYLLSEGLYDIDEMNHPIYYTGSAMQHAFGESEKNIIAVIEDVVDECVYLQEIDLGLPRKKILYMDLDKVCNDLDEEDIENKFENGDDIKLSISGNYEEFKNFKKTQKYKKIVKKGIKITYKNTKIDEGYLLDKINQQEVTNTSFNKIITFLLEQHDNNSYIFGDYEYLFCNGVKDNEIIKIK